MKHKFFIGWLILCFILGLSLTIGMAISYPYTKQKYELKSATEQDVKNFLQQPKHDIHDDPVFSILSPYQSATDFNDADFVKEDQQNLYVLQKGTLLFIHHENKQFQQVSYDSFYPYELQIVGEYLLLFGGRTEEKNIEFDEDHTFPYERYECEIMILNKKTLQELRHFIFYRCYYKSSIVYQKKLCFVLGTNDIINPETDRLIYPQWEDSMLGLKKMTQEHLYLSKAGNPIYAMTMIGEISLENMLLPIQVRGIVGAEGFVKLNENYLLMGASVYDKFSITAFHIFQLDQLTYIGCKALKGYLLKESAMSVYQNSLQVILSYYEEETFHNVAYKVYLKQLFWTIEKEIAPYESIYAIQFHHNYAYVSAYQYIDPLYIVNFSHAKTIETIAKKEMDFVNEYIEVRDDEIRTIGRKIDTENRSLGLVFARFHPQTLDMLQTFYLEDPYADSEIRWNEKSLFTDRQSFYLPGYDQKGSCVYIFQDNPYISLKKRIRIENEYLQRAIPIDNILYVIGYQATYLFSLDDFSLRGTVSYES